MQLSELAISDGYITKLVSTSEKLTIFFKDWQEKQWTIEFFDVFIFESFSAVGSELEGVQIVSDPKYIEYARKRWEEPDLLVNCYIFLDAWGGETVLKVVAVQCEVHPFNRD